MGKEILMILILFTINHSLFSQEDISIFSYDNFGNMVTDDRFISAGDRSLSSLPFSVHTIDTVSITETNYIIKTGRFENWQEEPGDFDVIQFYKNNQPVFTYKDGDGIVKFNKSVNAYAFTLNQYSNNGYFMEVKLSDTTKLILFVGENYGTDLAKLILFAVTPNEVKLVYNQKTEINTITKTKNHILMTLQSNIPEEDQNPVMHTIWSADGVLKFKDN